jgi:hypothetical protein
MGLSGAPKERAVIQDDRQELRTGVILLPAAEALRYLDRARRRLLQAGALEEAAHLSIGLVLLLAQLGRPEGIREVSEELRLAVRRAGQHGEALFALYQVTNAVARGTDLQEAAAQALTRLAGTGPR